VRGSSKVAIVVDTGGAYDELLYAWGRWARLCSHQAVHQQVLIQLSTAAGRAQPVKGQSDPHQEVAH
jgi:hypothetical protein